MGCQLTTYYIDLYLFPSLQRITSIVGHFQRAKQTPTAHNCSNLHRACRRGGQGRPAPPRPMLNTHRSFESGSLCSFSPSVHRRRGQAFNFQPFSSSSFLPSSSSLPSSTSEARMADSELRDTVVVPRSGAPKQTASTRSLQQQYRQSQSISAGSLRPFSTATAVQSRYQRSQSWASDLSQGEIFELGGRVSPAAHAATSSSRRPFSPVRVISFVSTPMLK